LSISGLHLGCGKSFQPDNETMKVCADCADMADRIVARIEQAAANRNSQYGINGGPRKRRRFAFDALADVLN